MQECADRFVFGSAIVQNDGGNAQEMADVGGLIAFAHLVAMHLMRVFQGVVEPRGEPRHARVITGYCKWAMDDPERTGRSSTRWKRLGLAYETYDHPAVFTSEDADKYWRDIPATPVKNLFLRNKKGNREYLVILGIDKRADLRQLVKIIGDDRFSFGSAERLMQTMGLTPGSVSPFGLIHACES